MARYGSVSATRKSKTSQKERMPGRDDQVKNSAGGFVFAVDNWTRLDRFLILGSEGGSYYANERKLTLDNLKSVDACIAEDGARTVARIVEISDEGRAPKNDPALVALARCAAAGGDNPSPQDLETRRLALDALPKVARIGTHLFQFAQYVDGMRGWGTALRNAVANWYNNKPVDKLAYQVIKYQARVVDEGNKTSRWSHRDLFRKAHPQTENSTRNKLYGYVTQGWDKIPTRVSKDLAVVKGFEKAKKATSAKEIVELIGEYNLPREAIPTEFLSDTAVWMAMLPNMPIGATVRNLGKMSSIGILDAMSDGEHLVLDKLSDTEYIRKSRLHPLSVLVALKTYQQGQGFRGSNTWNVNQRIVDALDEAFYLAFDNVESTGKRYYLGIDVSGSMTGPDIANMPGISPRVGAAAMSMLTARTEKDYYIAGFSTDGDYWRGNNRMVDLGISPKQRLDTVIKNTSRVPMGGTDCALPMIDALEKGMNVDTFVVYTDSETWAGSIHPKEALRNYRKAINPSAKLVVVGMVSNNFSIADPKDAGQLDVIGFDTATPNIIAQFSTQ